MSAVVISGDTSGTISINAPATAGSNTITLPATTGTAALTSDVIGVGQTWTNVTSSRLVGTTYTNSTGKPIFIMISSAASSATNNNILVINGVNLAQLGLISGSNLNTWGNFNTIIPNGSTYAVTGYNNGLTLSYWAELR